MQEELYKAAMDDPTPAKDKASCARAWEVLEERKRILRGRPLPGSFKPEKVKPKRKNYWERDVWREAVELLKPAPAPTPATDSPTA